MGKKIKEALQDILERFDTTGDYTQTRNDILALIPSEEDIIDLIDNFGDRSPKGQDIWVRGYFSLPKGDVRNLGKSIRKLLISTLGNKE